MRDENIRKDEQINELKEQLAATGQGPSTTMDNNTFMAMLKAFFEQKESKVSVPEPHDWEGDRKGFETFRRECEMWLEDQKVQDEQKAIILIAGYMKGSATQWYTINTKARELAENPWILKRTFWREVKERFGESDPSFNAQMKLEKLKQGQKSVHTYNSMFNEHAGLTRYNKVALVNMYFGGLNDNILQRIFNKDSIPLDIRSAQDAAVQIENLENRLEQFTSGRRWEAPIAKSIMKTTALAIKPATTTPIAQSSPLARTTGPMDLDRARKEGLYRYCSERYMPRHLCSTKQRVQEAYKAWSQVVDASPNAAEEVRRSMEVVKVDKGKKREVADPDIGETLARIMDTLNIHGKMFDEIAKSSKD